MEKAQFQLQGYYGDQRTGGFKMFYYGELVVGKYVLRIFYFPTYLGWLPTQNHEAFVYLGRHGWRIHPGRS